MNKINRSLSTPNTLKVKDFVFKFFGKNECPADDVENQLPILIHSCPENFSTVDYFGVSIVQISIISLIIKNKCKCFQSNQALQTKNLGRLVIYAPVITSTQSLLTNLKGINGLVVIGRKQTRGVGRHKNQVDVSTGKTI